MPGRWLLWLLAALPLAFAQEGLEGAALVQALQKGGYVIYFRHAATDFSQADTDGPALQDCGKQRNLNEAGRAQARAIGEAFRALKIPVGNVLASPYCRTRETAQLAFGRFEVSEEIRGGSGPARAEALRRLLALVPPAGTNTVLVAHQFNLRDAAEVSLAEGEAAVFRPLGPGGFRLVARVLAEDWAKLPVR